MTSLSSRLIKEKGQGLNIEYDDDGALKMSALGDE